MDARLLAIGCLMAFALPRDWKVGMVHVSVPFVGGAVLWQLAKGGLRSRDIVYLSVVVGWPVLGALVASWAGIPISWASTRGFVPLLAFCVVLVVLRNGDLGRKTVVRSVWYTTFLLCLFVLLQSIFELNLVRTLWAPPSRIAKTEGFKTFILAPTGNPNNSALLFGLSLLSMMWLSGQCNKLEAGERSYLEVLAASKIVVLGVSLVLLAGIVLAFARTVLASVLVAIVLTCYLIVKEFRGWRGVLLAGGVGLIFVVGGLAFVKPDGSIIEYYMSIFNFTRGASVEARLEIWESAYRLVVEHPVSLVLGIGEYEAVFGQVTGKTVLDSGVVYLILTYGVVGTVIGCGYVWSVGRKIVRIWPFVIYLAMTSITLPFISDYILNMTVAYLVGLVVVSESRDLFERGLRGV